MNRTEIIKLIRVCATNYRNWPGDDKEEDTITLWLSMLEDLDYDTGRAAVKVHLSRSVYPPTIADIRDAAALINRPRHMDAITAWSMITEAIRKYGYYREVEALESLPAPVADMARRFSWRELCLSDNVDTLRAQFRMAWETMEKRRIEDSKIPAEVMTMIESSGAIKRLE